MSTLASSPVVHPFHHQDTGTWSYVVADPDSRSAAIIDPVLDFDAASARTGTGSARTLLDCVQAQDYAVHWILETHAHADHLTAAQWIRSQLPGSAVAVGAGITSVQAHFAPVFGFADSEPRDGSQFDRLWQDDERFRLGGIEARVIAVPGHTADSIAYLIGDALFAGDSLFMPDAGTARCDFPGGDAATLYRSIRRLYGLPDETRVFVCHDYGPGGRERLCETTIGAQKRDNIHLGIDTTEAQFVERRRARDATLSAPRLLLPSLQVNLRAGHLPPPDEDGQRRLRLPVDRI